MNRMSLLQDNHFRKAFIIQILFCIVFLSAFATSRLLFLPLIFVISLYIFQVENDDLSTATLLFVFFYSGCLKLTTGTTSLFLICKLAYILRGIIRGYFKKVRIVMVVDFIFIVYCIFNMIIFNTNATIRILNLFLWTNIAYLIVYEMTKEKTKVLEFFVISFFISCIVALFSNILPEMRSEILNVDTYIDPLFGSISRYTGMFGDPNMTTVIIILCCFASLYLYTNKCVHSIIFFTYAFILTFLGIATGSKSCFLLLIVFWMVYFFSKTGNKYIKFNMLLIAITIVTTFTTTNLYEYYYYRFFGAASGITTGRDVIWKTYIDSINNSGRTAWLWGFGINVDNLPNGRAAHDFIIQIIYNIGVVGLCLYILFWTLFTKGVNSIEFKKMKDGLLAYSPMVCIISSALFLDTFFIEAYYFAFALSLLLIERPINPHEFR